jgi:LPXTG-motif cell wall-anchored protein
VVEVAMDGLLMWGLVLPVLLVVAGVVTLRRRKDRRR